MNLNHILCDKKNLPAIVFCSSRTGTEITAQKLRMITGKKNVFFYHAGLSKGEKEKVEAWFFDSNDGVLTATCAYGIPYDPKVLIL